MSRHISTLEVADVYRGKSELLQMWEEQPAEVRLANKDYIAELIQRVRQARNYLEHRKDAPIKI